MTLNREQIAAELMKMVGKDQIITDEQVLKESSVDRFRRFEAFHGVFKMPLPAAVVNVNSTQDVATVIQFANHNKINVVPTPQQKGGSKPLWKTPLSLTDRA